MSKYCTKINKTSDTALLLLFFSDLMIGFFAFYIAVLYFAPRVLEQRFSVAIPIFVGGLGVHIICLFLVNLYHSHAAFGYQLLKRVTVCCFFEAGVLSLIQWLDILPVFFSTLFIMAFVVTNYAVLLICRTGHYIYQHLYQRKRVKHVIIYGSKRSRIHYYFKTDAKQKVRVIQLIKPNTLENIKHTLTQLMQETAVDAIWIQDLHNFKDVQSIINYGESAGIPVQIDLRLLNPNYFNVSLVNTLRSVLIQYHHFELTPIQNVFKRIFDLMVGCIGFILFLGLYPIVGLIIKLDSKGPVLFKQARAGQNGRTFYLYKFRTMGIDAEAAQQKLIKSQSNIRKGPMFKMMNDPRITRVGRILRKCRIDEFPQFINVMKSEMSIVGTRPPLLSEVKKYKLSYHKRLKVKPGITGLWQISNKNKIRNFSKLTELDFSYLHNWTPFRDFWIVFRTIVLLFYCRED